MSIKAINKNLIAMLSIVVTIIIFLFSYFNTEKYKDELRISKSIEIHTDLKYNVEIYMNILQDIMQSKISINYIHNNIIKSINLINELQYEMQYKITSFPKYASVDISKMKEEIKNNIENINNKLVELENSRIKIKETFEKLKLYEKNKIINEIQLSYMSLFNELTNMMKISYEESLNIQKNISTINDILIVDNEKKEIPNDLILPLEKDEEFNKLLKEKSTKIKDNLDLIDPRLL
ncbi:hypothetical protein [Aliarcobacter butzleri]|uniref:hypothetical protein n=1 Tax=Aliarcobacter butzleri TaxID=28197 RepID=UPI0021B39DBE|nr:hypothetical protein [Aliarcobacter butzleri]MCT7554157.1 hypothetical protein [Aliarcobacter butzleri]MCT7589501.1 hypothetical protein [Aliarcobacter butzleri]